MYLFLQRIFMGNPFLEKIHLSDRATPGHDKRDSSMSNHGILTNIYINFLLKSRSNRPKWDAISSGEPLQKDPTLFSFFENAISRSWAL